MKRTLVCVAAWLWFVVPGARADELEKLFDDAKAKARTVLDAQVKEDFDAAAKDFGGKLKDELPPDKLKESWKGMIAQVGPFKKVHAASVKEHGAELVVTLTCEFEKAGLEMDVTLEGEHIVGLFYRPSAKLAYRAPPYVKEDSFREVEVKFNPGDWFIPGTLTLPKGEGPFPVVVLVHGSGPHDRDETIGPNLVFRDLAWGLATKGIAVLRYEKRTELHGYKLMKRNVAVTIKEEVLEDVSAAVALLRTRKDIDPKQIYVLGHSLGGYLAPLMGEDDPKLAGLILFAANIRPLGELVVEQADYIMTLPQTTNEEKAQLEEMKKQTAQLNDPKLADKLKNEQILGASAAYWLTLRTYDPAATVAKLKMPMLVLQGERDYQVTMTDFEGWKKALKGHDNVRFQSYPKLNHLFMEGMGKAQPREYGIPGHVSVAVVDDIAGWIKKH